MHKIYEFNNRIINKDCLDGLKNIPDESADIIIIDPPYNIGKDFGNNKDSMDINEYITWAKQWFSECYRILKPNGLGYIYGFSEILAHISTQIDLKKQRWLIWHYTNKVTPGLKFWQRSHESIICFWKDKPHFNTDDVRVPYTENFIKNSAGKKRTSTKCRFNSDSNYQSYYTPHEKGALPKDVFEISTLAGGKALQERYFYCKTHNIFCNPKQRRSHDECDIIIHPTQKPMDLTRKLIMASRPKDCKFNVLIPFCGSGSECYVTKEMGGNYLSFEINPDYIKLAENIVNLIK
ncbi:DNA-methyltransferase [Mycoplasma sp. 394]